MLKKFFILTGALCLVFCGLPSTNIYALEEDSIVKSGKKNSNVELQCIRKIIISID